MSAAKHFDNWSTWRREKPPRVARPPLLRPPRPLSSVFYADPGDFEPLMAFLLSVRGEIGDGAAEEDMLAEIAHDLTRRIHGVALVVRGEAGIEGSLGIAAGRPLFSRAHFLRSVWFVVAPEARSTGHAKSLLLKGREFAESLGRPLVLEEMAKDPEDGKLKLISRHLKATDTVLRFRHLPSVGEAV